ncbi:MULTISPECIES: sugar phosphate isomerase/epimerase family protein [unclassified Streptomyces]|uniref:sugar phosphate isomerase/epimerase family protein n=1 Tax=unclassified Streptomyces TaxID=2593676 RepID=UPI002E27CAEB|nr:sugar phosphate isomerase/epimerase family protein [Streptomyces sp. NBC_01423]WSX91051.1 sugar phosphate isomerase/epimerase [Streptomyces sp. NBC_00891]WSY05529.1 sugar phosphate isomerase/epimerase [Streptomyces sp. NBC_00890]WSZ07153.1 sugar phosphate isomerase/epimerase [Streptomyces sp. NBC_00869]WSZ25348.1 sugar phosphate isomerase/epimerase [Streptomyces sp. NBC_00870]
MKLAFSTLGVPGLPIADVVRLAAGNGYQGVELRAHPEEPVHLGLGQAERASVVAEFERGGVEILGVAGYAKVAAEGYDQPVLDELAALTELARDLGAPYVRVFPGGGDLKPTEADEIAARRLGAAAPYAADLGVCLLLETHDSHRAGVDVARVAGTVGHKSVGALWDVMHTWLAGEEPVASHAVLAPHLGYVQVKDIASTDDTTPLALGAGVLPLRACLDTVDPDGWVCWEYEKRWYPEAAELPELLGAGREHLLRLGAPKQ